MNYKLCIIAAIAENRAIGKDNKLLWRIGKDLERFKKITFGHPIIMGRKTFESIGKPLPGRINIIVTRNKNYKALGCIVCYSLDEAIKVATQKPPGLPGVATPGVAREEIFVAGGGQIYNQTIGMADKLYLTIVKGDFEADTFFPDYSDFKKLISEEKGESEGYKYRFLELERGKN